MNILILTEQEKISKDHYKIQGDKFLHLKKVLKVATGHKVFAGELNGLMGHATVLEILTDSILISTVFDLEPPTPLPVTLVMALSRPTMFKRILKNVSMLGVKEIYLINTSKVEKSFWQSQLLEDKKYEKYFMQGLEQSKDTVMPKLYFKNKFKIFVEDDLQAITKGTTALVAHPGNYPNFPQGITEPLTLVIGPEGGFTDDEVQILIDNGLKAVSCGPRILRMETAVVALLSQHASFLS